MRGTVLMAEVGVSVFEAGESGVEKAYGLVVVGFADSFAFFRAALGFRRALASKRGVGAVTVAEARGAGAMMR